MEPFKAERWRKGLAVACLAALVGASVAGLLLRHRVAYDLQIRRGGFVVGSVPPEKAAAWVAESLRSDPSSERRARAARFSPQVMDETRATGTLLMALGDVDPSVQVVAYAVLVGHYFTRSSTSSLPGRLPGVDTWEIVRAVGATRCTEAQLALFKAIERSDPSLAGEAARSILSGSTDSRVLKHVLGCFGGSHPPERVLFAHWDSPSLQRSIAQAGLKNANEPTRLRCARILLMAGGKDLRSDDETWIARLRADPELLLDAWGSFKDFAPWEG